MQKNQNLERLMNEYGDTMLRLCYLYLKDYHLAEDVTQETFIKAMQSYDSFNHQSSEKTWLTRIAINSCKNVMRSRWFKFARWNIEEFGESKKDNLIDESIEKNSISEAIMKLNMSDRQIIILYYYQQLSIKEIADIIGKKENAVQQCLRRARKKLKTFLMEAGYGENIY